MRLPGVLHTEFTPTWKKTDTTDNLPVSPFGYQFISTGKDYRRRSLGTVYALWSSLRASLSVSVRHRRDSCSLMWATGRRPLTLRLKVGALILSLAPNSFSCILRILADVHKISSDFEGILWRCVRFTVYRRIWLHTFLGGHDNGYLPTLAALENERLLQRIVLLKGYNETAIELKALNLPTLSLDKLFRSVKLPGSLTTSQTTTSPSTPASDLSVFSPGIKSRAQPPLMGTLPSNNAAQLVKKMIDPSLVGSLVSIRARN